MLNQSIDLSLDITECSECPNSVQENRKANDGWQQFKWAKWVNVGILVCLIGMLSYMSAVTREPKAAVVLTIVLFHGLFGGVVNLVVVYLIFNRVIFVPGSGTVERNAKRIKNYIASMALTSIIPYEKQKEYYIDSTSQFIENSSIEENFISFFRSEEFSGIIRDSFDIINDSFEGFILKKAGIDKEELENSIKKTCIKYSTEAIPKIAAMITSPPFYSSDTYHLELSTLITNTLDSIPANVISDIIYEAVQPQLNLLSLCGNCAGAFLGLFVAFVIRTNHLYEL